MKILILTQPLGHNYGGILQAWALQQVLKRMGHEVVTDNPVPQYGWRTTSVVGKTYRAMKKYLLGQKQIVIDPIKHSNQKYHYLKNFVKENMITCDIDREQNYSDFDAIVVGSDQVWRPVYNLRQSKYFLDFAEHLTCKKIAYAASFGKDSLDEFSPEMLATCKRLLAQFDSVSVREASAVELCKNYFDREATHVLDPTLLLDQNDYEVLIENKSNPTEEYVLSYVLDETAYKRQMIEEFAHKNSLPVKDIFVDSKAAPSISDWLYAIKHAKYIITDSFHGMVFSIIFRKQFLVVGNLKRGMTRFISLLSMMSLSNRLITEESVDIDGLFYDKIDYCEINSNLSVSRDFLVSFIGKSLFI